MLGMLETLQLLSSGWTLRVVLHNPQWNTNFSPHTISNTFIQKKSRTKDVRLGTALTLIREKYVIWDTNTTDRTRIFRISTKGRDYVELVAA